MDREELLNKAEQLIENGDLEEAYKLMDKIKEIDKQAANNKVFEKGNSINSTYLGFANGNNKVNFLGGGEMARKEETAEYNKEFFDYMQGKKFENSMTTVETGGAVIPVTTFNQIIDNIKKQTGIISKVRILNVPGKMVIPQSQVIEGAAWHTEGTEIGDSTKEPNNVSLSGYELAKLFSMSVATQSMSMKEFEDYLTIELTNAMSSALNQSILTGTGTGQPTGIIKGTTWNSGNSKEYSSNTAFSDIVNGMSLLSSNFRQNACWFMNSTTLYSLLAKVDTNGNPVFTQGTSQEPIMKLLGKEIVIDDYIDNDIILFGDASYYFLNFSKPVSVQRSEDAGFTKASILYRAMAVVDGKPVAPSFIKFTKKAE